MDLNMLQDAASIISTTTTTTTATTTPDKDDANNKIKKKKSAEDIMISSKKEIERRLVEYFCVVSSVPRKALPNNSSSNMDDDGRSYLSSGGGGSFDSEDDTYVDDFDFQPIITSRYPLVDHKDNELHESVTSFCHPKGSIRLRIEPCLPKVHSFVMTGGRGKQMYGTCLTIYESYMISPNKKKSAAQLREVYLPKCLCLLSAYPYLVAFREYLTQLHRLTKMGNMPLPVERYIANFCSEIPAPPPGSFEVQTTILDSVIKFWSPPHNQPIPWVSLPFSHLFECLDVENIITVWHALALERQVLLTSTQLSLLSVCSEILVSLLFPMRWSHAYIPVLPHFLIPILSAPMPYLCGLYKANLPDALLDLSRECIVVDLDTNQITMGPATEALPPIPYGYANELKSKLEENVGMVFREARSLTKHDDFSDRGQHLPSHVKMMADAMWESKLALYDEAFHLAFTPEQARRDFLNGNDCSGQEFSEADPFQPGVPVRIMTAADKLNLRKQSRWDAVQEAFLHTYVHLLRHYRNFMVFPSKENEGAYGGAGFRAKAFVSQQRYDMQEFLRQLIATQMFDDFVTKRLYGSGEADVIFFDQSVDRYLKNHGLMNEMAGHAMGGLRKLTQDRRVTRHNRVAKRATLFQPRRNSTVTPQEPLLQSARVHRMLKTIVPPDPNNVDLPMAPPPFANHVAEEDERSIGSTSTSGTQSTKGSRRTRSSIDNTVPTRISSSPKSSRTGYSSAYKRRQTQLAESMEREKKYCYMYSTFPSELNPDLFGTPRPLPAAVLAEFDRQRENAAKFRRRKQHDANKPTEPPQDMIRQHGVTPSEISDSPEIATFTVFFMSFTAVVGKELIELSENPIVDEEERTILSTYIHPKEVDDNNDDNEEEEVSIIKQEDEKKVEHCDTTKNRFSDTYSRFQIEEAKATSRAKLGLAFEMLKMMRERGHKCDPAAYQCLIDACGRCGDTKRATKLLGRMHEDGIVADGVVYSCLVSAFSTETAWRKVSGNATEDLPEWANGASVEMDWNKLRKSDNGGKNKFNKMLGGLDIIRKDSTESNQEQNSFQKGMKRILNMNKPNRNKEIVESPETSISPDVANSNTTGGAEAYVTDAVLRQILLGESLLEIVYPDICIDTDNELCPRCNTLLTDDDVVAGWKPNDSQDYTTKCKICSQKFVPHFCVQSSLATAMGSKGPGSPLFCERLSPWVLEKELRSVMGDKEGIENLLSPEWREKETKNAVLYWNLILSFMRYRFPFTFLLQGSFDQNLIQPTPDEDE